MNTHAEKTQENKSQSVANAVSQKKSGSKSTFQFVDNRPEAVGQRKLRAMTNNSPHAKQDAQIQTSSNSAAQLRLIVENYNVDYDSNTKEDEINQLAEFLIEDDWEYREQGFTMENIAMVLKDLANNGENTLTEIELKDKILATKGVSEEKSNVGEVDIGEVAEIQSGQKVGKRTFPGNSYHITIKPKIIKTIGRNELSLLVYHDSKHNNFDFWIGKNGEIYAGINNSGGHEKDTGYILTADNNIIKA